MKKLLLLTLLFTAVVLGLQPNIDNKTTGYASASADTGDATDRFADAASATLEGDGRPVAESDLRDSSAKAIKIIQHAQATWSKRETCDSCHHQLIPQIPLTLAVARGVPVDETAAKNTTAATFDFLKDLDGAIQGYDYIDVFFDGWSLVAANVAGVKPNLSTSVLAQRIASRQQSDGSWMTTDLRPPQAFSSFSATAVCAKAILEYLPHQLNTEKEIRLSKARDWLLKMQPRFTEERVYQLFGLYWTGADPALRKSAARQLLAEQRPDGGWSQLPGLDSDVYSTGEVLVALKEGSGLAASDLAYQRGLRFLLSNQQPDGSWRVKSRLHPPAPVSPPYFETGFPYQHDQFVSMMGTSWAAAACLHAIPINASGVGRQNISPEVASAERAEWIDAALNGTAGDLKKLLDAGMKPDCKTAEGTTALMMAARDLEKVKLLVERGADLNARAATGITPLMVASMYTGNVEVVRLLLKKGARPISDKGVEVRYDSSAFFFSVMAGDVPTAAALLDAGASVGTPMKVLGRITLTPLLFAASGGDLKMTEFLLSRGADANETDPDGISMLSWATIGNHGDMVKVLLKHGAKLERVDKFGMTPLLYAASINFGTTDVLEVLLSAGADRTAKTQQGLTARDLATKYGYSAMTNLLASEGGKRPR